MPQNTLSERDLQELDQLIGNQFLDQMDWKNRAANRIPSVREDQIPLPQMLGPESDPNMWFIPRGGEKIRTIDPSKQGDLPDVAKFLLDIIKTIPQPTYGERQAKEPGEKIGKKVGDITDLGMLLLSLGAMGAGAVKSGGRIGPARLQKLYDYVMRNKELFPDVSFDPIAKKEITRIGKIGHGAEGPVYRVGKMTLKTTTSRDPSEAEAAYRLRSEPGFKHFLGTVAEAKKDLPQPSEHSEIMDYITKGIVKPEDVNMLGLFTRFQPKLDRARESSQTPDIDLLRQVVAAAIKAGVFPTDVHKGNIQYRPSSKGLSEPVVIDLGLTNLASRKGQRPDEGWGFYYPSSGPGGGFGKEAESILLDRIIRELSLLSQGTSQQRSELAKKSLIRAKLSKGGE